MQSAIAYIRSCETLDQLNVLSDAIAAQAERVARAPSHSLAPDKSMESAFARTQFTTSGGFCAMYNTGERVRIIRGTAKGNTGTVRAVLVSESFVGVELDSPFGKNDGTGRDGKRHFTCAPNHGIFLRLSFIAPLEPDLASRLEEDLERVASVEPPYRMGIIIRTEDGADITAHCLSNAIVGRIVRRALGLTAKVKYVVLWGGEHIEEDMSFFCQWHPRGWRAGRQAFGGRV